jgi:hypothetical protein
MNDDTLHHIIRWNVAFSIICRTRVHDLQEILGNIIEDHR